MGVCCDRNRPMETMHPVEPHEVMVTPKITQKWAAITEEQ